MLRTLFFISVTLLVSTFYSCVPEYVAPIKPDCEEVWNADTTMIQPAVYLDYLDNPNGIFDPADIIFSDYDVQLFDALTDEMLVQEHAPDWRGCQFSPVDPGMYYLRFMIPDGYKFVTIESGVNMFDSDLDSDVIDQLGYTDIFEIQCHEQITSIKAIIQVD